MAAVHCVSGKLAVESLPPPHASSWLQAARYHLSRRRERGSMLRSCTHHVKVTFGLVRSRPLVAILPLLLFLGLSGLGVGLTYYGIQRSIKINKDDAATAADSLVGFINVAVQAASVPPKQVNGVVQQIPYYPVVLSTVAASWSAVWLAAPKGAHALVLLPQGKLAVGTAYPNADDAAALVEQFTKGSDVMALNSTGAFDRAAGLRTIRRNRPDALYSQGSGYDVILNGDKIMFVVPVWVRGAASDDKWGFPDMADCPAEICYDNATQSKWWGFAQLYMDIDEYDLFTNAIKWVTDHEGFNLQLQLPRGTNVSKITSLTAGTPPDDAYRVLIPVAGGVLPIVIWTTWQSPWLKYMYIVAVGGALIVSLCLLAILLSREEHRVLLLSLLPKQTIQRMRDEVNWMEAHAFQEEISRVSIETPAQNMLDIIQCNILKQEPSLRLLLAVRDALQRSADVYKPTLEQLRGKMEESEFVDAEVRQALVAQLVGSEVSSLAGNEGLARESHDTHHAPSPTASGRRHSVHHPGPGPGGSMVVSGSPDDVKITVYDNPLITTIAEDEVSHNVQDVLMHLMGIAQGMELHAEHHGNAPRGVLQTVFNAVGTGSGRAAAAIAKTLRSARSLSKEASVPQPSSPTEQIPAYLMVSDPSSIHATRGANSVDLHAPEPVLYKPVPPAVLQLEQVLATADNWAFDAFALEQASNGRPLSSLAFWLFNSSGLIQWAHLDVPKLIRFLQRVEDSYPENPYHNRKHAANVLQCMHVILHRGGLMPGYVDKLTLLACYLAAVIHDVEHRGRNNDFLINMHDDLAVRYNDRSPLESHHLAAAFTLLKQPEMNFLSPGLTKANWNKLRRLVIDLVLATDMKQHFATLGQFDSQKPTESQPQPGIPRVPSGNGRKQRLSVSFREDVDASSAGSGNSSLNGHHASRAGNHSTTNHLQPLSDTDRLLSLQIALKCADVGHLTSPLDSHLKWVTMLEEEFFQQGDDERSAGLAISPLCDRTKEGVTKSQVGFFDFVVRPMFKSFYNRFSATRPLYNALMDNYAYWSKEAKPIGGPSRASRASKTGNSSNRVSRGSPQSHTSHVSAMNGVINSQRSSNGDQQ